MNLLKKIIMYLGSIFLILFAVLLAKTLMLSSRQLNVDKGENIDVDDSCFVRLSGAIQIPTVSHQNPEENDTSAFESFYQYLNINFPLVFSKLDVEKVNEYGLLMKWEGRSAKSPVVLMAHQDVVPVNDGKEWEEAPFSGKIDDQFVWGRGAIDDKGSLLAILEAVEKLISEGYVPERTFYLAFGHDEEIMGLQGAHEMAKLFKQRGITPEFVLDEGLVITRGLVPMTNSPVALIGTSEKGYVTLKLSIDCEGGHSSTPARETAISILAGAIQKVTLNRPDARICPSVEEFIKFLGPEIGLGPRFLFANRWLLKRVILSIYTNTISGNAMVRTTTAPTMLHAGVKENVLPHHASATINFRILPGETSDEVMNRVKSVVADDRIIVSKLSGIKEPATVSPTNTLGFETIHYTIKEEFPETIVVPSLMLASSDSRHFSIVCDNIYRFAPYQFSKDDMARIHGRNERISKDSYKSCIRFYYRLIKNCN